MIRRQGPAGVAAALVATLLTAASADAHGFVGKRELPIPTWLFGWAAAAVLVISFVALAALWPHPRLQGAAERRLLRLPRVLDPLCGGVGVLLFAGLIYAGLAGTQDVNSNILPTVVYVAFWVGIPFVSLAAGDVFRAFNPWRAIGRAAGWLVQRIRGDGVPEPLSYPERLGRWPAVVGIMAFAVLELAIADRDDPSVLATLALAYAAVQLVGMSLYGTRAWCERGDAFGVYFALFASLSAVRWTRDALRVRAPLSGTARVTPDTALVALVCVMIGSTSFDGFTGSAAWSSTVSWAQPRLLDLGLSAERAIEVMFTGGLLVAIALIAAMYLLGCRGMRSAVPSRTASTLGLARRFAPTLVPIALAYVMAHYFGLLAYRGQALAYLASDPLGDGTDLFGTATATINYGWISATGIWYVQVAAVVLGHAAALALAHDRALVLFPDPRTAARSQRWMLAVMVAFTSLALFLLSNTG